MVFKFWLFVVSFRLLKKKIQGGAPGFFSAEPGDSKGLVLWSENEGKIRAAEPWDPNCFRSLRGVQGYNPGEVGSAASIL